MKTTVQILYDLRLFDNCDKAVEVQNDYFLTQANERRLPNLDEE